MDTNSIYGRKTDIEHSGVKKSIEAIDKSSKNMAGLFDNFTAAMSKVYEPENFSGEASDELQKQFAELKKKFDSYTETVARFAKTVEAARASQEATEQEIKQDAGDLPA